MNGTERRIEILTPFSQAIELMKHILFRPFDIEKWLVIGFAAFLAHFGGGGFRFNFNLPTNWRSSWQTHSWHSGYGTTLPHVHVADWVWPLLIIGIPFFIILARVLAWIGARGRFIFTDCIVYNRGAIVAPWHEYRREGNSLFLFSLIVGVAILFIAMIGIVPVIIPAVLHRSTADIAFTIGLVFWIVLIVVIVLCWSLVSQLMVPVMYRRRCRAWEAFKHVVALVSENAVSFILYIIFLVVVSIAIGIAVIAVGCATCCIGACLFALPYVGTVILLPVEILLFGYTLLFLRQFGPDFDVWGGTTLPAAQSVSPVSASMPTQTPPVGPAAPTQPQTPPTAMPPDRSPYESPPDSPPPIQP